MRRTGTSDRGGRGSGQVKLGCASKLELLSAEWTGVAASSLKLCRSVVRRADILGRPLEKLA